MGISSTASGVQDQASPYFSTFLTKNLLLLHMQVSLTIVRYPRRFTYFALLAMAVHRLPLWLNGNISFYKLLGCGRNGSFDTNPDWQQWGILAVFPNRTPQNYSDAGQLMKALYGSFIARWYKLFKCETWTVFLTPAEGHGYWDGKQPFGELPKSSGYDGPVAILTRATIRLSKLKAFWKNVHPVARQMDGADGLITSLGIGEMPFIKQATFSVWNSKDAMKRFAYQMHEHTEVIKKTRKENWYSEDMFIRFIPVASLGTIRGKDPLAGKL